MISATERGLMGAVRSGGWAWFAFALVALFLVDVAHLAWTALGGERGIWDDALHGSSFVLALLLSAEALRIAFRWRGLGSLAKGLGLAFVVTPLFHAAVLFLAEGTNRGSSPVHLVPVVMPVINALAFVAWAVWPVPGIVAALVALMAARRAPVGRVELGFIGIASAVCTLLVDPVRQFVLD